MTRAAKRASRTDEPSRRGEALVAVMNNLRDWQIVLNEGWYRIPVDKAPKRWPPKWLAIYHTKVFGDTAFTIRYFGRVSRIAAVRRRDLFPEESKNPDRQYYQVFIEHLEELARPIVSYRLRLIVFIPTTFEKLMTAVEINDLFDDSPLEDALWSELKKNAIRAERQYFLEYQDEWFCLDFALFCQNGKIDIETDGDSWHTTRERVPEDNRRNNALAAQGYQVLRFNTMQIQAQLEVYCLPKIVETATRLGGAKDPHEAPRAYTSTDLGIVSQTSLFEDLDEM